MERNLASQQEAQNVSWEKLQQRVLQEEQKLEASKKVMKGVENAVFTAAREIEIQHSSARQNIVQKETACR